MKIFKTSLHLLIGLGSLTGFLVGWAVLAHSGKPVQPGQTSSSNQQALAPLPSLPPIQSIQTNVDSSSSGLQFFVPRVQQQSGGGFFSPGLSTRGS
jgi:hypothetical protein